MPLQMEAKQAVVAEVSSVALDAQSAVAAEYRGLSVAEMTQLRNEARTADVYLKVVKNTLARRAVAGTSFECLSDSLKGPLVLAFSRADPGAAARVIRAFAKDHDKLVPVAVALGGALIDAKDIGRVADLPTLDEARASLVGVLAAPAVRLVRTLAEPGAMLARVLGARSSPEA
ncbi:MAG TPA: 50S ribosomal protein L10 [Gammaproteobacteria bacterium]|nr:50S ribosomal protein L10 [Gammaproteobacteria bacterium]